MRPTTTTSDRRPAVALAVGVVAIVLGILGMHALVTHGVMAGETHDLSGMSGADAMSDMALSDTATSGAARTDPAMFHTAMAGSVPAVAVAGGGDHHDMGTMVMLCVAMLAAGAGFFLLIGLALRRCPRPWPLFRATELRGPPSFTWRLGTGPPPVWQFSVIRC